jgi:very-short-patch-repair endonuclease
LRRKYVEGAKFRRQEPIGRYVVDFVNFEKKLVVEVDGGHHNDEAVRREDEERTAWLANEGFRVLRFWNNEVLTDVESVLGVIRGVLNEDFTTSQ